MKHMISIFRNPVHVLKFERLDSTENKLSLLSPKSEQFHNFAFFCVCCCVPGQLSGISCTHNNFSETFWVPKGPQEMEGGGTWSCSPVSYRGQIVEEGVIDRSSLDADPDPPEGQRKARGNRIHTGLRIRQRICWRLMLLWMDLYSSYTWDRQTHLLRPL